MFSGGYCGGTGLIGWLLMIAFWATLIALVVWAVTRLFPDPGRHETRGNRDVEQTLDRQLAAGQIDPQTYHRVREELAGADRR